MREALSGSSNVKVAIVYDGSETLRSNLPVHPERHQVTWSLLESYALTVSASEYVRIVASRSVRELHDDAVRQRIEAFHDSDYVSYLESRESMTEIDERPQVVFHGADSAATGRKRPRSPLSPVSDEAKESSGDEQTHGGSASCVAEMLLPVDGDEEFGLQGDCHPFVGMWRTAFETVRGTLAAVNEVLSSLQPGSSGSRVWCALHWWGGRHHARREAASGFCFLNDVVIGVQMMQERLRGRPVAAAMPRVLVVDIDAHHGDGVQDAFYHDPSVVTVSSHCFGRGIFPGTGRSIEDGRGTFGKGCCFNFPLAVGCTGTAALEVLMPIVRQLLGVRQIRKHRRRSNDPPWYDDRSHFDVTKTFDAVFLVCGADCLQGDPLGFLNFTLADIQIVCREVMAACGLTSTPLVILGAGGYDDSSFAKMSAAVTRDAVDYSKWLSDECCVGDTNDPHTPLECGGSLTPVSPTTPTTTPPCTATRQPSSTTLQATMFPSPLLIPPQLQPSGDAADDVDGVMIIPIPLDAASDTSIVKFTNTNFAMNVLPPAVVPRRSAAYAAPETATKAAFTIAQSVASSSQDDSQGTQ